jgi:hypothetical protein
MLIMRLKSSNKAIKSSLYVYIKIWSRPSCICVILYFKLNGIDVINQTKELFSERTSSIEQKVHVSSPPFRSTWVHHHSGAPEFTTIPEHLSSLSLRSTWVHHHSETRDFTTIQDMAGLWLGQTEYVWSFVTTAS